MISETENHKEPKKAIKYFRFYTEKYCDLFRNTVLRMLRYIYCVLNPDSSMITTTS